MTEDDSLDFIARWNGAFEITNRKPPSDTAVGLAFIALQEYELEQVIYAINTHIRNSQFPPTPHDIIKILGGGNEDCALLAWSTVEQAIRQTGPYPSVTFPDRVTMIVIKDIGGWIRLCETQEKDLPFVAQDFKKRYAAAATSNREHPSRLAGINERHNTAIGAKAPKAIPIGNKEQARLVFKTGQRPKKQNVEALINESEKKAAQREESETEKPIQITVDQQEASSSDS